MHCLFGICFVLFYLRVLCTNFSCQRRGVLKCSSMLDDGNENTFTQKDICYDSTFNGVEGGCSTASWKAERAVCNRSYSVWPSPVALRMAKQQGQIFWRHLPTTGTIVFARVGM